MKKNINKKIGATLLATSIMTGSFIIPVVNAAETETKAPSITYQAHVQNYGWLDAVADGAMAGTEGQSLRMEAVRMSLQNCEDVSLNFDVHIQDYGWKRNITGNEIGTTGESRRLEAIVIRSNGLKEKGYRIEYRVHIQNIGWSEWVEEGKVAGTEGMSLRIEAIEAKIIEDKNAAVEAAKTAAINTLTNYDIALDEKLSAEEDRETYSDVAKIISDAIANIKKADSKEKVEELLKGASDEAKALDKNIDETVQKVLADRAKEQEKALATIEEYKKTVPTVKSLSASDKNIINTRIEKTTSDVKNAKTPRDVKEAVGELQTLVDEQYAEVALALAKSEAIAKINEFEDTTDGVKTAKANAIKAINDVSLEDSTLTAAKSDISGKQSDATTGIKNLVAAQEYAEEAIKIYQDELKNAAGLTSTQKSNISSRLKDELENTKKADTAEKVNNIMNRLTDEKGEGYLDTNCSEVVEGAQEALEDAQKARDLKEAINALVTEIEAYPETKYPESKDNDKTDEQNETKRKLAEEYVKEYIEKAQKAENTADVNKIKGEYAEKVEAKITDTLTYEETYNSAMSTLNQYANVMKTLDLAKDLVEEVNTYITNTRTNITNAKTTTEVTTAIDRFTSIMDGAKYSEITEAVNGYDLVEAKEKALKTLNKYTTEDNLKEVISSAKAAIKTIEAVDVEKIDLKDTKAIEEARKTITETLENAENDIKGKIKADKEAKDQAQLEKAQTNAYNKIAEYLDYSEGSTDEINNNVKAAAEEAKTAILAVTLKDNNNNVDKAVKKVNDALTEGLNKISEFVTLSEQNDEQEFNDQRKAYIKELNDYNDIAVELNDKDVQTLVADCINDLNNMKYGSYEITDLTNRKNLCVTEIEKSELNNKIDAIKTLNEKLAENEDYEYTKAQRIIKTFIENKIKEVKAAEDAKEETMNALVKEVTDLLDNYKRLDEVKTAKIKALQGKVVDDGKLTEEEIKINAAIDEIKDVVIDGNKLEDAKSDVNNIANKILAPMAIEDAKAEIEKIKESDAYKALNAERQGKINTKIDTAKEAINGDNAEAIEETKTAQINNVNAQIALETAKQAKVAEMDAYTEREEYKALDVNNEEQKTKKEAVDAAITSAKAAIENVTATENTDTALESAVSTYKTTIENALKPAETPTPAPTVTPAQA